MFFATKLTVMFSIHIEIKDGSCGNLCFSHAAADIKTTRHLYDTCPGKCTYTVTHTYIEVLHGYYTMSEYVYSQGLRFVWRLCTTCKPFTQSFQ